MWMVVDNGVKMKKDILYLVFIIFVINVSNFSLVVKLSLFFDLNKLEGVRYLWVVCTKFMRVFLDEKLFIEKS